MKTNISDLIDFTKVDPLLEGFNKTSGFVTAILDLEGNVLSKSGWRQICTDFHRVHPEASKNCAISDTILANKMSEGEKFHYYKCLNGLIDVAVPIIIKGEHVANLFSGQFFLEEPDYTFFEKQAEKYGFDVEKYMQAVKKVPVFSKEKVNAAMEFLLLMTNIISELAFQKQEQIEAKEKAEVSEERFALAIEASEQGIWDWNVETNEIFYSEQWKKQIGYTDNELKNEFNTWIEHLHSDEKEYCLNAVQSYLNNPVEHFILEFRFRHKDGTYRWIHSKAASMKNHEGKVIRMFGSHTDFTEQKEAVIALKQSEEKFAVAFKTSPYAITITQPEDGKFIEVNDAFYSITGYSPEEVLNNSSIVMNLWIDAEDRNKMLKALRIEGTINGQEFQFKKKNAEIITGLYSAQLIDIKNKTYLLSSINDITERKKTDEALRASEEKFKKAFIVSPDSININRLGDGMYVSINNGFTRIMGYTEDDIIGKTSQEMNIWVDFNDRKKLIEGLKQDGIVENLVADFKSKDGKSITGMMSAIVIELNGEQNILSITRDVTELKKAEQKLIQSEEKLSTLFGSMTEIVVMYELVFNENGEAINYLITDCNKAFTEIMGIKKEDAVGKLANHLYDTVTPPYLNEYTEVCRTGKPHVFNTFFEPMEKYFLVSAVSLGANKFSTITTDITSNEQIHEIIKEKNKELENYIYVASHDLRSPLVNIQGFSQRLQKQTTQLTKVLSELEVNSESTSAINEITTVEIPKSLNFIQNNVSKMDTLINGLLQLSRTGQIKISVNLLDMNKLINKILAAYNYQLTEINAEVIVDNLSDCYGDENQLNQLFSNIIGNAVKYRDKNKKLRIEISSKAQYKKVIYSIKDNGIGMNKRHLERIWDVFYRVDASATEAGEGLGLSLAKRIVDKHKGKIWAESTEGVGSTFYVELHKNNFEE